MKRAVLLTLVAAGSAFGAAEWRTNNTATLSTVSTNVVRLRRGETFQYKIEARQGTNLLAFTDADAVRGVLTDLRLAETVATYTGTIFSTTNALFKVAIAPSVAWDLGGFYELRVNVWRGSTNLGPIAYDPVHIDALACGTCAVGTATSGGGSITVNVAGASSGPFVGPGSTGLVSSATSDSNKYLRGDGQWHAISTPVEVWSNGVSLGVVNGLQVSTGLGVRVVTDGTSTLAQIYPTVTSGQGSSIPGSTQLAAFAYTGSTQTYIVASGMTQILAKIWGGAVGASGSDAGYTEVTFPVAPLETLHIVVGQGTSRTSTVPGVRPFGGAGYLFSTNVGGVLNFPGGSGSFIFRDSMGTQALIACAGGAGYASDGGGLTAQNNTQGSPASQTNGGVATVKTTNTDGGYLLGGLAATNGGSAGGSGYYGGYGSHTNNIGAGGGSGTIQSGYGITVRSNYNFDDDYPGQPSNYAAPVATGAANGGGHGYIILKGFVAP